MSHPVWVRGLKLRDAIQPNHIRVVAPRVGAWIETKVTFELKNFAVVAPRVGAWIETYQIRWGGGG